MHIGIDARFIQGPTTGVTNYLINLLRGISRTDRDNDYSIFLSDPNYNGRVPQADNFKIRINTANDLVWKNLWLPGEVKKSKIDVMHFPAYTGSFVNIGNNIVTIHDLIHKVNPAWFSAKELMLIDFPIQLAVKRATKIIAVSENTKRDIIKYYNIGAEKIAVTLEAADSSFRPLSDGSGSEYIRKKYNIDADFILYVGVLFKRRNIDRLLEAFSMLKGQGDIKHKLVIAGPGKDYFNLDSLIDKYSLGGNVIYLNYVEQDDLPLLYNAALFFVYPSLYEGFGLPVLEAMSCGKAVITSNASSLPEIVGDSGLLINPHNTQELYDAMHRLTKDKALRDNLGKKAQERSGMFNWDRMAEETVGIYEEAVKAKTEVSRKHFYNEGERIKIEDRKAIYELRQPRDLAMQVDFGFARYDMILRLIDKYCPQRDVPHLDLGCGLGYLMAKMAQRNFRTSGVDISRSFLDIAEEKLKYWHLPYENLLEADLQKHINLPDNYFDVITSTDVLEHIERPELFLNQIYRLLKPCGKAIISTNNSLSAWGLQKIITEKVFLRKCFHPIDRWTTFLSFKGIVARHGFKVLEMRGTYFLPLSKLKSLFSLLGIYKRRFQINDYLSGSLLKYFGRDIIFVLEKYENNADLP